MLPPISDGRVIWSPKFKWKKRQTYCPVHCLPPVPAGGNKAGECQ